MMVNLAATPIYAQHLPENRRNNLWHVITDVVHLPVTATVKRALRSDVLDHLETELDGCPFMSAFTSADGMRHPVAVLISAPGRRSTQLHT
jgi:hypothetical protein